MPYINQILEAKPEAVWCPLWGGDAVKFIKQALPTGLFDKVKFAFPVAGALEVLVPLGKEMPEGWKIMRAEDHSGVEDCLWGETEYSLKCGFAIPASFESIQGEEICRSVEELKALSSNKRQKD